VSFWVEFFKYVAILTYLVWGFVVALETVLVMAGSPFAIEWVRKRYTLKFFMFEIYLFYPMILLGYLFLEVIPWLLNKNEKPAKFDIANTIYKVFKEECDKCAQEEEKEKKDSL